MEKDTEEKKNPEDELKQKDELKAKDEPKVKDELSKRRKRLKAGGMAALLFLLLYVPSLLNWLQGNNVASDILRYGVIEESTNADGVLIRDEVLLDAPRTDGVFVPEAAEGERIPAASRVATVLNSKSDELLKQLETINLKIAQAQNDKAKKADFFSADTVKIDEQIGQSVEAMIALCNSNQLSGLGQLKTDVDRLIEKRAEIVGNGSQDKYIDSLKQQRDSVQQRINSNTGQVLSQYSGIVSYVLDGYEQELTPRIIKSLTPSLIDGIKVQNRAEGIENNRAVANKAFAKVIRGSEMYIAAVIPQNEAAGFHSGKVTGLRINDIGMTLDAVIANISLKDGKAIITVRVNRGVSELAAMRRVNIDFIKSSTEGLKVPLKCLRNFAPDGSTADIMLIKANVAARRKVDVLSRDNEYAIIRTPDGEIKYTVNLYDTYILNPDNIKEGDIVAK